MTRDFTLLAVVQAGRLAMEALLLLGSIRHVDALRRHRVVLAEPRPGPLWSGPELDPAIRAALVSLGAEIRSFAPRHFGDAYPHGNKIEALDLLAGEGPVVFLDTDTLVLSALDDVPFDFARPVASLRRSATWPKPRPGGPDRRAIWTALYRRFGLDPTEDKRFDTDDWRRFAYFNAGFVAAADAAPLARHWREIALAIRDDPPGELAGQSLDPWLDQVALPLAMARLGGAAEPPDAIDGTATCHWRLLPLLYARESDRAVAVLEAVVAAPDIAPLLAGFEPVRRMVLEGEGRRIRAAFHGRDYDDEASLRRALKAAGHWVR